MQRDLAALEDEKNKALIELQAAKQQIEMLRLQIEQEKAKSSQQEVLTSRERAIQHELHLKIQELERERDDMKNEIARLTGKITGTVSRKP